MTARFDNIGGIRLVPHGESSPQTFAACRFVRASASGYAAVQTATYGNNADFALLSGQASASMPVLDVGGEIYLDGAPVLDASGDTFSVGGYLGRVSVAFQFTHRVGGITGDPPDYPYGQTETVTVDFLGVVPAAFSGGLRVAGLTFGAAAQSAFGNNTIVSSVQTFLHNWPSGALVSRRTITVQNFACSDLGEYGTPGGGTLEGTFTARVRGVLGNGIQLAFDTTPFTNSTTVT